MRGSANSSNWIQLWGIFKVKLGTGRISFFLKQAEQKDVPHNGSATSFHDLGLYIFPTEQEARAFVSQRIPGVQFSATENVIPSPGCKFSRATIPALYGIQLGMSLEEVVPLFPGSADEPKIRRALELSRSQNARPVGVLIENRTSNKDLNEVKRIFFQLRDGRVFSFSVEYRSRQWTSADEFIERRGELLNLSSADSWEPVEGNARFSKYLICDGVEIRFYAAPACSSNLDYISVSDTRVEAIPLTPPDLRRLAGP